MVVPRSELAMSRSEMDAFLRTERTLRLATVDEDGWPHVVPLWFVWRDGRFYVNNLDRSKRTRHLAAGTTASLVVDAGHDYQELRGVSCRVTQRFIDAEREETEPMRREHAAKYLGLEEPLPLMRSHTWLELVPVGRMASWDFRKLGH
jgi:nitroimidazol reductase NimA-like FMN-containing flavoprotein (pyridoxamine 5'-phosphate oxidase superfamily)